MEKNLEHKNDSKLLRDVTLEEYFEKDFSNTSYARDHFRSQEILGGGPVIYIGDSFSNYHSIVLQYQMKNFFEKEKGFEKIYEKFMEDGIEKAPRFESVKFSEEDNFLQYSAVNLAYRMKDGTTIMIRIYRSHPKSTYIALSCAPELATLFEEWKAYSKKNNFFKNKKINASCEKLDLQEISWDNVILSKKIEKQVKHILDRDPSSNDVYKANNINLKRGFIFSGPPGTGKTTILKIIANLSNFTVIYGEPSDLKQGADVKNICEMAKELSPALLILEDLDWIAEERNTGDAGRVIQLMNELDGIENSGEIITLATTNDIDKIEKAIKNRPGRFDRVISVPLPDKNCRRRMIELFCKSWDTSKVNIDNIVGLSEGMSGAHLSELCKTATINAIDGGSIREDSKAIVTQEHFASALEEIKNKDFSTFLQSSKDDRPRGPIGFSGDPDYY